MQQRRKYTAASQKTGAPGRTRTCDHELRRHVLYPAELRAPSLALGGCAAGLKRFMGCSALQKCVSKTRQGCHHACSTGWIAAFSDHGGDGVARCDGGDRDRSDDARTTDDGGRFARARPDPAVRHAARRQWLPRRYTTPPLGRLERPEQAFEHPPPIAVAVCRLGRALGMRHQSKDIAAVIDDPRDVVG